MTNTDRSDEPIRGAGLEGIGNTTVERLESVGISSVEDLADADVLQLTDALSGSFSHLRPETLREKVEHWVGLAGDRASHNLIRTTQGHVFLVRMWTDENGRPIRSRFGYRSPQEPTSEEASVEYVGWSPLAFARFVERMADLSRARGLSEERVEHTEVVEWSRHQIQGQLVGRGSAMTEIRAEIPTGRLDAERGEIRWRASGRLVPLGGGPQIALGTCVGRVGEGDAIEVVFGSPRVPNAVHRAWIELAVSPAAEPKGVPRTVGPQSDQDS